MATWNGSASTPSKIQYGVYDLEEMMDFLLGKYVAGGLLKSYEGYDASRKLVNLIEINGVCLFLKIAGSAWFRLSITEQSFSYNTQYVINKIDRKLDSTNSIDTITYFICLVADHLHFINEGKNV